MFDDLIAKLKNMPGSKKEINPFDAIYSGITFYLTQTLGVGMKFFDRVGLNLNKKWLPGEVLELSLLANAGDQELITALMSFYQQKGDSDKLNQLRQRYPQQTRNPPQQG